ncbi:polycomb protein suz12-like [Stylophora pistillata]|uniref:Polycomb protein suz12 n=1 Tax=Stylophora pistillata TaxID=50429 RepID=A0A2B4SEC9_STYPI|nr:polycomb protein suz12-like [Stylophora pistillata]PFX29034.1 Polycomb protein suz12 [Stylophora pistillata]
MTSEKADVIYPSPKKTKFEQLRADHELFLQAFEKPTQIYRFLRTRNAVAPVFLHRTLSYMKHRRTRPASTKKRKSFKINDMLEKVESENNRSETGDPLENSGYMNLTFTGFFHGSGPVNGDLSNNKKSALLVEDFIKVDVLLVKICHKRRKESDPQVVTNPLGQGSAPFNPRSQLLPVSPSSSVSIPNGTFRGGKTSRTCILSLQVSVPYRVNNKSTKKRGKKKKNAGEPLSDAAEDENGVDDTLTPEEPPTKRRRVGRSYPEGEWEDGDASDNSSSCETAHTVYTAELIVFDNNKHCLLTDGDYELALHEKHKRPGRKKGILSNRTSWENVFEGQMGPFEVFAYGPTLKFKLSWSGTPLARPPRRPTSLPLRAPLTSQDSASTNDVRTPSEEANGNSESRKRQRVFYQFIYNNNTRQQTEARDDFFCPWCSIDCRGLYSLLKHLKLCHRRFIFTYAPHSKGERIDVSVNENYDGSYDGKPEDMNDILGYALSREGPCRRVPSTHVVVWRPQRRRESLSEFLEPDDGEFDSNRPFYNGHHRMYFHSETTLPIITTEKDQDSEDETIPEWMRVKTIQLIDEFTDVNDGEKELMKLWNLHLMKNSYIADFQVIDACRSFIDKNSQKLRERNLERNFLLHLVNLHDFNLITSSQIEEISGKLRDHWKEPTSSSTC